MILGCLSDSLPNVSCPDSLMTLSLKAGFLFRPATVPLC